MKKNKASPSLLTKWIQQQRDRANGKKVTLYSGPARKKQKTKKTKCVLRSEGVPRNKHIIVTKIDDSTTGQIRKSFSVEPTNLCYRRKPLFGSGGAEGGISLLEKSDIR